jgi:hypothetical protein
MAALMVIGDEPINTRSPWKRGLVKDICRVIVLVTSDFLQTRELGMLTRLEGECPFTAIRGRVVVGRKFVNRK